jgi:hypothetical protein
MYAPDAAGSMSSPSSSMIADPGRRALQHEDADADGETRAPGATRRMIDTMLRWMSSTSVTTGPALITLPIHFSSPVSMIRRNSSELPSKYFLSPGLACASASRSLGVDLGAEEQRAGLVELHVGSPDRTVSGCAVRDARFRGRQPTRDARTRRWFGDKDSNLDEQLQRLLSCH